MARLCLNPKEQLSSNPHANDFNAYFSTYKQNNSVEIMRYGEGLSRADYVTFSGFPASVTSLAYNDAYYEVTDVDNADAWKKIFDEIANDIATRPPPLPLSPLRARRAPVVRTASSPLPMNWVPI